MKRFVFFPYSGEDSRERPQGLFLQDNQNLDSKCTIGTAPVLAIWDIRPDS
jgi:hypothetical protein